MPTMVVRQPDGLLAGFSSVVDNFTFFGGTREQVIRHFVERDGMSQSDAEEKVERGLLDVDPWTHGGPPGSGHDRWDAALGTIVFRHGEEALRERLAEMGFAHYPVDGIIEKHAMRPDPAEEGPGGPRL